MDKKKNDVETENTATPPASPTQKLIAELRGINEKVGKLVTAQKEKNGLRREVELKASVPVRIEIVGREKVSVIWGIVAGLIVVLTLSVLFGIGIWWTVSKMTATLNQTSKINQRITEDTYATKKEVSALKETSGSNIASLKNELAETKKGFEGKMTSADNELTNEIATAKKEAIKEALEETLNAIEDTKKVAPQSPAKDVAVPANDMRVNILLVDEYGRVLECFKGVRVSDITRNDKHTHFIFEGKPNDWNQKVVFSYSYADNEPPITGTIYCTTIGGAVSKVINVPPCNVYQDSDGTIRYDDLNGGFPHAPKGAGYITAQSTLPTQP